MVVSWGVLHSRGPLGRSGSRRGWTAEPRHSLPQGARGGIRGGLGVLITVPSPWHGACSKHQQGFPARQHGHGRSSHPQIQEPGGLRSHEQIPSRPVLSWTGHPGGGCDPPMAAQK